MHTQIHIHLYKEWEMHNRWWKCRPERRLWTLHRSRSSGTEAEC